MDASTSLASLCVGTDWEAIKKRQPETQSGGEESGVGDGGGDEGDEGDDASGSDDDHVGDVGAGGAAGETNDARQGHALEVEGDQRVDEFSSSDT